MHEIAPFAIPAMRDFVPQKLRPWIIIAFVLVFQFSGGVYLAAVSEMVGSTALMQEDIMMARMMAIPQTKNVTFVGKRNLSRNIMANVNPIPTIDAYPAIMISSCIKAVEPTISLTAAR